jgi:hypothetical protein
VTVKKVLLRSGTQVCGGLFHAGRHPLHHTAHDHESDGRKGKQLRNPDAKQAIKPARGRHIKSPFQKLIDHTGAAKQQNQAQTNHKRRRDDGQQAITRSGPCTRGPALRSASRAIMVPMMTVPVAVSSARNKRVPGHPQRTPPARQLKPQTRSLPMRSKIAVSAQ